MKTALALFLVLSLLSACSSSSSDGLSSIPAVATIVNQATPAALKASRRNGYFLLDGQLVTAARDAATIKTNVEGMFKGTYGKLSGGSGTGYINSYLEDLDSRFTELKSRFSSSAPKCFSNTAQTYTVDASALNASLATTLKLDMDVQCLDLFDSAAAGEQSGDGSGLLFGKNGSDYSLLLLLNTKNVANTGFGYAAKVTDKGGSNESVDLMFVEAHQADNTRMTFLRLKAKPGSSTYELLAGSSQPSGMSPMSGGSSNLGCNVRLISDGTYVSAHGNYLASGTDCTMGVAFDHCYSATDLSVVADSLCDTLETTYTIGAAADLGNLVQADFTGKNDALFTAMQINTDTVKGKTTLTSAR